MEKTIAVIRGDGIGPEIVEQAIAVLDTAAKKFGHSFCYTEAPMGGCAIDEFGVPLPESSRQICLASDSVLLGAVGGPKWDAQPPENRPEKGLLKLRGAMNLYSNIRPAHMFQELASACPLRADIAAKGVDFVVVRELIGGVYFGEHTLYEKNGEPAAQVPEPMRAQAGKLAQAGKTPMFFSAGGRLLGVIAVADVIKPDSPQAVRELQNMGIYVVMVTGDNERTAKAIGAQAGVDQVIAGVLPDGKESVIRELRRRGKVAMVGDGINDAPALTRADIGIAIGAGTDVAIDAADVVLMKSRLSDVPAAIRLSRATLRNIHENLFWAFFYNTIGIPIAAGVFIPLGLTLNPMLGAAAMSLSSFCVVSNALRLNLFKLRDARHDHKRSKQLKEIPIENHKEDTNAMKKTMKIEGMMCGHCEATVKKALEAIEGVASADVSHESGTAVVTLSAPVEDAALKKAVEDKDYKVTGIE